MQRPVSVCCLVVAWGLAPGWSDVARPGTFLSPHAVSIARAGPTVKGAAAPKTAGDATARRLHRVIQACEQAALTTIRRQSTHAVQQVSLGDEGNPQSLSLTADTLLTGTGQMRQDAFWHDFYFGCEVSADGGEALNFSYTLIS